MRQLQQENLTGKRILEIGTGCGGTTRELVQLLSNIPGAQLIATDRYGGHFPALRNFAQ